MTRQGRRTAHHVAAPWMRAPDGTTLELTRPFWNRSGLDLPATSAHRRRILAGSPCMTDGDLAGNRWIRSSGRGRQPSVGKRGRRRVDRDATGTLCTIVPSPYSHARPDDAGWRWPDGSYGAARDVEPTSVGHQYRTSVRVRYSSGSETHTTSLFFPSGRSRSQSLAPHARTGNPSKLIRQMGKKCAPSTLTQSNDDDLASAQG